jgi:hypothetical protein
MAEGSRRANERHDERVPVRNVAQLVRENRLELAFRKPAQEALRHHEHRIPRGSPGGEGVRHVCGRQREPGSGEVGHRREPLDDRPQLGLLPVHQRSRAGGCERDPLGQARQVAEHDADRRDRPHGEDPGAGQAQNDHDERDRQREVQQREQEQSDSHPHAQTRITPKRPALHYRSGVFVGLSACPSAIRTGGAG